MAFHYIWLITEPKVQHHLRRANEERAAAFHALLQRISGFLSGAGRTMIAAVRRARLRRRTFRELSALSDRALCDIGLRRHDIAGIAMRAAEADYHTGLTVADLRAREIPARPDKVVRLVETTRRPAPASVTASGRRPDAA